jgi:hypothetical protein
VAATSIHYHTETFWTTSIQRPSTSFMNVNMRTWSAQRGSSWPGPSFVVLVFTFAIPVNAVQAMLQVNKVTWRLTSWRFDYTILKSTLHQLYIAK